LSLADLRGADLSEALLKGTNLTGAVLTGTVLIGAELTDAQGVTKEQLEQAKSLKGATMPNGQKYEEWLKDSEGRKEDAENE